jgi:cell division septum initiation protein DivIVA
MQAEQQADDMLKQARERKERLIKEALAEREQMLTSIKPPTLEEPTLKPLRPDIEGLKRAARKNKAKAVARILEAIHEA